MGATNHLELKPLIEQYNINVFVETGTGEGMSLKDVLKYNLDRYYSVEIHEIVYQGVISNNNFPDNVKIYNSKSVDALKQIFEIEKDSNLLIYLDGHFANGCDFGFGSYLDCKGNKELHLPLESELRLIKEMRPRNSDIIICDDVRIYQDGPFEGGNWDCREYMEAGDLNFAYELFQDTHDLSIDYRDQGYLFIIPKI